MQINGTGGDLMKSLFKLVVVLISDFIFFPMWKCGVRIGSICGNDESMGERPWIDSGR